MYKVVSLFLMGLMYSTCVLAEKQKVLALYYDEIEMGAGAQSMRYLINDQFLRIDNGDDKADFVLFDVNKKNIYSVNHEDQTILKIENNQWSQPEFDFKVSTHQSAMNDAPKIQDKTVYTYSVNAGDQSCTEVFLIKDTYTDEMKIMHQYQQVLSGQQVATLNNTPKEMHTPCFLVDQVYHAGGYFKIGLPVKISYSRDYIKFLSRFKNISVDAALFELPQTYKEYKTH